MWIRSSSTPNSEGRGKMKKRILKTLAVIVAVMDLRKKPLGKSAARNTGDER